jgi:hypothetical protein
MNNYYVYIYLDPRKNGKFKYHDLEFDNEPFYVGKGINSRHLTHLNTKRSINNPIKVNKIKKIQNEGLNPIIIKYKENLLNNDALELEIDIIKKIGRLIKKSGPLTNYSKGGETYLGYKHKEEYLDKLKKPVLKYDLIGNLLEEYDSVKQAGEMNNESPQTISSVCNGSIKIYKNKYIFIYKSDEFKKRERFKKQYSIIRIDYNHNEVKYDSGSDAAIKNNTTIARILAVCKGDRFQTGGYFYRFKDDNLKNQFNEIITNNFNDYLEIMDREIVYKNIIYKNILHTIHDNKNTKVGNIYQLLMSNKNICEFNEFKTN